MMLDGVPVVTDKFLTESCPDSGSRFFEYERSDEWWLRKYRVPCGLRQVPSRTAYMVGGMMVMHPAMLEEVKRSMR